MSADTPSPSPMSALAISMVKNEADIIEASVRHNLHYLDLMVVIDNCSSDGTREILEALCAEGLPILIFDDPVFAHFQSEKVTEVYRRVVTVYQPDLVFLLDADEFIRAPDRQSLEGILGQLRPGEQAFLPWATHIPDPQASAQEMLSDPLGSSPWRRRQEEPMHHKAVIRRRPQDDYDIVIEQGNHCVWLRTGQRMPSAIIQGASLSHLPVRSVSQVSAKAINGWLACVVRNRIRNIPGEAYQWKNIYDRITSGAGLTPQEITDVALNYAQTPREGRALETTAIVDPTPALYGQLRYLAMGRHDPLAKVALSVAQHIESETPLVMSETVVPMDLAAIAGVLSSGRVRTIAVLGDQGVWVGELSHLIPGLIGQPLESADSLIAPDFDVGLTESLMSGVSQSSLRHIICWLPIGHDAQVLGHFLSVCAASGWEPDMMQTLGLRALATYRNVRCGGLVLRPLDASRPEKMLAVRAALVAMASQQTRSADPKPQIIRYPLQTLPLSAGGTGAEAKSCVKAPVVLEKAAVECPTKPVAPSGSWTVQQAKLNKMRVAVVTPYYKESRPWLERCLASVHSQDHVCEHFVIADGHPQDWLDGVGVRHIRLDRSHGDYGNTPRSIGAQLAVAEGFDAVAFLDADNWYEPGHVSSCVNVGIESGADYVVSRRNLVRQDGSILPWASREDDQGEHVDTSCFFVLLGAFHTLPRWLLMPKPMTIIGDRYYLMSLREEGLQEACTDRKTVNYLCGWADVYRAVGEVPPPFAKEGLPIHKISQWLRGLTEKDCEYVERLSGCNIGPTCPILARMGY